MDETQSLKQKQIAFAQNAEMVEAAVLVIKEAFTNGPLVGDSEYETVKNAIIMDTQQNLMLKFLERIDFIKTGGLHNQ